MMEMEKKILMRISGKTPVVWRVNRVFLSLNGVDEEVESQVTEERMHSLVKVNRRTDGTEE
jgi:hypothetical protein